MFYEGILLICVFVRLIVIFYIIYVFWFTIINRNIIHTSKFKKPFFDMFHNLYLCTILYVEIIMVISLLVELGINNDEIDNLFKHSKNYVQDIYLHNKSLSFKIKSELFPEDKYHSIINRK